MKGHTMTDTTHTILLTVQIAVHIDTKQHPDIQRTKNSLIDFAVGNLMLTKNPLPGVECKIIQTEKETVQKL